MSEPISVAERATDWHHIAAQWGAAYGPALGTAHFKQTPLDFQVAEQMPVQLSGRGEHVWLQIRKTQHNTEQVAKQIARVSKVAYRDVSYSGLKDFYAVTDQWFSVWLPGKPEPDWTQLSSARCELLSVGRHDKKLRRGTHTSNSFVIRLRDFTGDENGMRQRWQQCVARAVPNYFGPQRFGRELGNLPRAAAMLAGTVNVRDKSLRGILLSAARAWLFNVCLSDRVSGGTWATLGVGEPAMLAGSESFFHASGAATESLRLEQFDIHPSAPLWGQADTRVVDKYSQLHRQEETLIKQYPELANGLIKARLRYSRRPTRAVIMQPEMNIEGDVIELRFGLQKGQFATSVLRELVTLKE